MYENRLCRNRVDYSNDPVFQCRLAHGGPIELIGCVTTVRELHTKIACVFHLSMSDIMFCTRNTSRIDMSQLACEEFNVEDTIFAHVRGVRKDFRVTKECESFGVKLKDVGCGIVFIKRFIPNGIFEYVASHPEGFAAIGDQIVEINDQPFFGATKKDVEQYLNRITVNSSVHFVLVSPISSPESPREVYSPGYNPLVMTQPQTLYTNQAQPQTLYTNQVYPDPMYLNQVRQPRVYPRQVQPMSMYMNQAQAQPMYGNQIRPMTPAYDGLYQNHSRMMPQAFGSSHHKLKEITEILLEHVEYVDADLVNLVSIEARKAKSPMDLKVELYRKTSKSIPLAATIELYSAVH